MLLPDTPGQPLAQPRGQCGPATGAGRSLPPQAAAMLGRMMAGEGLLAFPLGEQATWERHGDRACGATLQALERVGLVTDDPCGAAVRYRPTENGAMAYVRATELRGDGPSGRSPNDADEGSHLAAKD